MTCLAFVYLPLVYLVFNVNHSGSTALIIVLVFLSYLFVLLTISRLFRRLSFLIQKMKE